MMGNCMDLSYDGNLISSFNGVLGGIDYNSIQENSSLGVYESTTSMSILSPHKKNHGGRYTNSMARELHIAFVPLLTQEEYAEFQELFFNSKSYKKMIYTDNDNKNMYYYMTKLLNPKFKEVNNMIVEVTCDVEYDSPYAYEINGSYNIFTNKGGYAINNTSHFDGKLYPNIEIQGTGQIILENTTNGSKFIVTLTDNEICTVDKNLKVSSNNVAKKHKLMDCDLTNGNFMYLNKGVNDIVIGGTSTLSKITILFDICKKVGV